MKLNCRCVYTERDKRNQLRETQARGAQVTAQSGKEGKTQHEGTCGKCGWKWAGHRPPGHSRNPNAEGHRTRPQRDAGGTTTGPGAEPKTPGPRSKPKGHRHFQNKHTDN